MTQACKKFMVSTMAALALAGVCLTASTTSAKLMTMFMVTWNIF